MQEVVGQSMSGDLIKRLQRLLPNGRGVWIPMDHGLSGYPEDGLDRMNTVVDSIIAGGADAIVCQKGVVISATLIFRLMCIRVYYFLEHYHF